MSNFSTTSTSSTLAPDRKKGRTLVVCFDGTAGEYQANNTNVVHFYGMLRKDKPDEQLCYYQPGIGTWIQPGVVSPFLTWLAKLLDEAFAWYLDGHVLGGYEFLMQNYRDGDKICIFGFSRGSYIARALAGALHKIGLISKDNVEQMPLAYKLYKRTDSEGLSLAAGFKQTFSRDVRVDFVGVWDTVTSVGLILSRNLPFTRVNETIKTFRHALSLDERRAKFKPNLYHRPPTTKPGFFERLLRRSDIGRYEILRETDNSQTGPDDCDVKEVWFAGCHGDVGGSTLDDTVICALSQISLRWMVKEVVQAECGVLFDEKAVKQRNIPVSILTPEPIPKKFQPDETQSSSVDAQDALQPFYDQLKVQPLWWILEVIPSSHPYQDADNVWHRSWRINFGRGRKIREKAPLFHVTVKMRMAQGYTPNARWTKGTEEYVT